MIRNVTIFLAAAVVGFALFSCWAWFSVEWYEPVEGAKYSCDGSERYQEDDASISVMSWNVQYMASKRYYFYYDGPDGKDVVPSNEAVSWTIDQVARMISEHQPDVVLLQEMNDEGDSRTHSRDQVAELQRALGRNKYACRADAHYWRAGFIPHSKILGSVSMKLTTLSRYPIVAATRIQLPLADGSKLQQRFYFQRALLDTRLQLTERKSISAINTHFDSWAGGTDLLNRQTALTIDYLGMLDKESIPWFLGGDLNALPPDGGKQRNNLAPEVREFFNPESELKPFFDRYAVVPSLDDLAETNGANWFTHLSNSPLEDQPNRTIDYIVYSDKLKRVDARVIQGKALEISDHFPVIGKFNIQQ